MATSGVINGTLLGVYMDSTLIASAKSCELTVSHDPRETTTKDDGAYETKLEGKLSWGISVNGLATVSGFSTLFTAWKNRTQVQLYFQTAVSGDKTYRGYAYITSLKESADHQTSAAWDASFEGTGSLTESAYS
jgi:predicted secreted protein